MPVFWQSSQEPLYVRTVWVHGIRHAILTRDDPYFIRIKSRQWRPFSAKSYKTPRDSRMSTTSTTNRQTKINFIITNAKVISEVTPPNSILEEEIEKLDLSEIDQKSDVNFLLKTKSISLNQHSTCQVENIVLDMKSLKSNRTTRTETFENTELSDRVMQWLDLAGKEDLIKKDTDSRLANPRHSWPEIQKKTVLTKSKTVVDIKPRAEIPKEVFRVQNIDRSDYPIPLATNTIENYAKQSRHVRTTTRNESTNKSKDQNKTKTKEPNAILQETRKKVATERKAVEKQYAELVSKNCLEEYKPKKQVHIFMPAVPKKAGSNTTVTDNSILSLAS